MAKPDVDYTDYSRFLGKKLYSKFLGPTKNYKANWAFAMPETLDPRNWKPIAPEEWKAHHERQAIRGRLRREYWTKAYHPVKWKLFNPITTDPMWAKYQKAKSVYFVRDAFKFKKSPGLVFQIFFVSIVLPVGLLSYGFYDSGRHLKNLSALDPKVMNYRVDSLKVENE